MRFPEGVISVSLHVIGSLVSSFKLISRIPPMQSALTQMAPASACTVPATMLPLVGGTVSRVFIPG